MLVDINRYWIDGIVSAKCNPLSCVVKKILLVGRSWRRRNVVVMALHSLPSFTLVPQLARHVESLSNAITEIVLILMEHSLGQRQRALASSSFLHVRSPLERLLPPDLVLVELCEVVDDDRNGKSDDENSTNTADEPDTLAGEGGGVHVPVAHRGHGDGRPPEGVDDAGEGGGGLVPLGHVGQGAEYQNSNTDEHQDQDELLVGGLHGVAQTWGGDS